MSNAPSLLIRSLTLPSFRLESLEGALRKLGKKAANLGCISPTFRVVAERMVNVAEDIKYPEMVSYSDVEIAYEVLAVAGGFRFVAKIEAADMVDGVPRNKVSGINLTDEQARNLITAPMVCEHCGIKRKRNACYSVQSNDGKVVMVGSSCLQAYMGIDPAAAVAGMEFASTINEIGSDEETWGRGSNAPRVMPLDEFAAATLSLVSKNGFVNAQAAEFSNQVKTGNDVVTLLLDNNPKLADWRSKMAPTGEHKAQAAAVLQRLTDRILPSYRANPAALDQFSFKFGILLNKGFVGVKDAQLAAAAIYFERGKVAKENAGGEVKNEWLPGAAVGSKIEVKATISMVKGLETAWGYSTLVKFVTDEGFPVTTFYSGNAQEFNAGSKVTVKGTVKRLEDGKFGKQTLLTRVKVA